MKITAIVLMLMFAAYWAVASDENDAWKYEASREWIYQSFDFSTGKKIGPQRTTKYDPWKCHSCHCVNKARMGGIVVEGAHLGFEKSVLVPINLSVRSK